MRGGRASWCSFQRGATWSPKPSSSLKATWSCVAKGCVPAHGALACCLQGCQWACLPRVCGKEQCSAAEWAVAFQAGPGAGWAADKFHHSQGPSSLPSLPCIQVNKTTLYFPKPLSVIYGNAMQWSYAGGFLKCVQTGAALKSTAGCPVLGALWGQGSLALPHAAFCAAALPAAESPVPAPGCVPSRPAAARAGASPAPAPSSGWQPSKPQLTGATAASA